MSNISENPIDTAILGTDYKSSGDNLSPHHSSTSAPSTKKLWLAPENLTLLLRGMGIATLLISVSIYLFQGWVESNDLTRYLLLLGHTAALAAIGFFCSRFLQEQKGARILLMLTLVFVAANFAIMGGLAYSLWGDTIPSLHGAIVWKISSASQLFIMLASSLLILVPLIFFGFSVLARRSAKYFSLLYLACNVLLLLPTRDEFTLGAITLISASLMIYVINAARKVDSTLATREGIIARWILATPIIIMLGRNMMHSIGVFMPLIASGSLLLMMRQVALSQKDTSFTRQLLEIFSVIPSLSTALLSSLLITDLFNAGFSIGLWVFIILAAGLLFDLSLRAAKGGTAYGILASLLVVFGFTLNLFAEQNLMSAVFCVFAGISLTTVGTMTQKRVAVSLGVLLSLVGLGLSATYMFNSFDMSSWLALAGLGVFAIVLASYIEKQGETTLAKLATFKNRWQSWSH